MENMSIIERENLLDNTVEMGNYLMDQLLDLKEKYTVIGDVRGKGLFAGLELVTDRKSKSPVDEKIPMKIAADCLSQGVMIGRTNRSFSMYNNTLTLSPALICSNTEVDEIISALDDALQRLGI